MALSVNKKFGAILFCAGLIFCASSQAFSANILIDPGHSPGSPGAISCSGIPEFLYNDILAGKIAGRLRKAGVKVSMTRTPTSNISLSKRIAKSKGKDLFLSIHHDSVQPQFLTRQPAGGVCSSKAQGFSIFVSRKNPYFEKSLDYARELGTALVKKGFYPTHHHAENITGENRYLFDPNLGIYYFDDLAVLKNAKAPAILLEAAVIVNPEDEDRAASDKYQRAIAELIERSVTYVYQK